MKVAIIHDWLVTDAGAEKVLRQLIEIYPHADIFSLVEFLSTEDKKNILCGKSVKTTFIQKLPFVRKYFRNYLPLFPLAIESLKLERYDLLISSSWAVAKGVKKHKNQLHICYCYTPIRYAWDMYEEYTKNLKQPKRFMVQKTLKYIRKWDIKTLNRVDFFIACSNFVASRIKKTYKIDNIKVIYPPVDTRNFLFHEEKENFYLTASRLVSYKKTKIIVEAFNKMPEKELIVIGDGEEFLRIKTIAKDNIKVLGYKDKKVLVDFMQRAKAFVYAAIEDFGIVPIEALSCGTPVIALKEGGTRETINEKNGVLFESQTSDGIVEAIKQFEEKSFDLHKISKDTACYSVQRFKNEIESFISSKYEKRLDIVSE